MVLLEHTLDTDAPPEAVWAVLMDLPGWPAWNTLTARAPDGVAVGRPVHLEVRVAGGLVPVVARFVEVRPARSLVWEGGVRGLFVARHGFDLDPRGTGTRIRHHEAFSGVVGSALGRVIRRRQLTIYREVNERLVASCAATCGPAK